PPNRDAATPAVQKAVILLYLNMFIFYPWLNRHQKTSASRGIDRRLSLTALMLLQIVIICISVINKFLQGNIG
ncbi:hypothetical protein CWN49_35030, partial [Klebsiella michiganensis]